ncbi:hypothetical protein [Arthrobacter sp. CAN_C5]|uniref:hypothetical protein n=1 Tax=Arthrobacter sp. CAN_C5 TaxID=2760706 RepID=UPI001AE5BB48|nr:hypothetical protein [Arthrobacter sp. CAN_C5]MBP2217034.1 hypothetical protein [Arthrobacter sp. CAN_C5]
MNNNHGHRAADSPSTGNTVSLPEQKPAPLDAFPGSDQPTGHAENLHAHCGHEGASGPPPAARQLIQRYTDRFHNSRFNTIIAVNAAELPPRTAGEPSSTTHHLRSTKCFHDAPC